ncbi:hypothetical protein DXG03_001459 [Asterophora parasitica]|uniref:Arrestin C-terminal-like domain-containing protein n=1 Tax=Asterophora parasitica TaxID=117018 RepID=A0A9P7GCJ3_9AGAR|nr:hypothetical protein DXG03_001459 [Asterophora parasitica]
MSDKNPLSIRLAESAVFLRSNGFGRRNRDQDSRPSMLRGLLVMELSKPTRITSIELELVARSSTAWPEGVGARRTDITEEHKLFHAETVYFCAGELQTRRNSSIGPGAAYDHGEAGYESEDQPTPSSTPQNYEEATFGESQVLPETAIPSRRLSADSSYFQRVPVSHEEFSVLPTPPYSPFSQPSSPSSERPTLSSAQTLEDSRNSLNAGMRGSRSNSNGYTGTASSIRSYRPDLSLSRRPSIEDVPEDDLGLTTPRNYSQPSSQPGSLPVSQPGSLPASRPGSRPGSRPASRPPSRPPSPPGSPVTGSRERRGRPGSRSRFSLSSVSSVLLDAVRSGSPKTTRFSESPGEDEKTRRGRTKEKGKYSPSTSIVRARSKERSTLGKLGGILKLDQDEAPAQCGWKEFKKGTYTYPISFTIPANSPPTLRCSNGTVNWRLRATVHRPGAFRGKFAAHREVTVITGPTEDDTEDTDNIIVERHWDHQLQYLISISGRSFYIGGTIPITFTLMPLAKIKIHRLSIYIEGTEPGKHAPHILPLDSDDVDAFRKSPLFALVSPEDDPSEMASTLMGPGPWTFHQELRLPSSCSLLRITNKNRKSNVTITHQLKCVMRVERDDDLHIDPKTGKRKLFDIVIQTPIQIFSCRCNPEWSSLPRYSETFDDTSAQMSKCPCEMRRMEELRNRPNKFAALDRMASRQSSDSGVSAAKTSPVTTTTTPLPPPRESIYSRSTQFERLITGQESEIGEAPPTYTACLGIFSQQSH